MSSTTRETPDGAFPGTVRVGVVDFIDSPIVGRARDQAARIGTSRHTETDVLSRRILRQLSNNGHAFDILDGGLEAGLHRIAGLREVNLQLRLTYVEQTWNHGQSR